MAEPDKKDGEIAEILLVLDNILSDMSGGDQGKAEAIAKAASTPTLPPAQPTPASPPAAQAPPPAAPPEPRPAPAGPPPAPKPEAAPAVAAPEANAAMEGLKDKIPEKTPKEQIRRVAFLHSKGQLEARDKFATFLDTSALTISKKPI